LTPIEFAFVEGVFIFMGEAKPLPEAGFAHSSFKK